MGEGNVKIQDLTLYENIQRVFRVAVKVFVSGRDLCIGILDVKFSGWRMGSWLGFLCD